MKTQQEIDNEFGEAYYSYEVDRHKYAIRKMFTRGTFLCEDLPKYTWWFVWIKLLVCLSFRRWSGSYMDTDSMCVMTYDEYHAGEVTAWESVWISPKLFSGWQCCVCSDSN